MTAPKEVGGFGPPRFINEDTLLFEFDLIDDPAHPNDHTSVGMTIDRQWAFAFARKLMDVLLEEAESMSV